MLVIESKYIGRIWYSWKNLDTNGATTIYFIYQSKWEPLLDKISSDLFQQYFL